MNWTELNWMQNKNTSPVLFWWCESLHGCLQTSTLSAFFIKSSFFQASTKSSHIELFFLLETLLASSSQPMAIFAFDFVGNTLQRFWCPYYLRAWHRLLGTLLPSIFMTGVHPPFPHPKSPIWQRTDVGFESKIIVIICVLFVLDKEDTFWLTTAVKPDKPVVGGH